jgi:hypothetical protein
MGFRKITTANPIKLPPADVRGVFLHWTAGRRGQQFPDYHFLIDADGSIYQNNDSPPGTRLEHTWHRNTGTIGIAAMAMFGATEKNYGPQAFTREQIESMCARRGGGSGRLRPRIRGPSDPLGLVERGR